jgi:O-antigen ligase
MLKLTEKIFAVLMLLYMTGAILPFIGGQESSTIASNVEVAVQLPLYTLSFLLIALHWPAFLRSAWKTKWILTMTVLAVASTAWSQVPIFTLRRSLILVATTAFGIYFGARFGVYEQLRILAYVMGVVICASFFFAVFLPQYGIDHTLHTGSWQGVFAQKNSLGRIAVLSVIVFLFVQLRSGRWRGLVGIGGALVLLALSRSATAVIVLGLAVGMMAVLRLFRTRFTFAIPVLALGGMILSLAIFSGRLGFVNLLHFLHRDPGMTGRTSLWGAVMTAIAARPWFGYGFEAFWLGMRGASGALVQQLHWSPPHSHNGFLDLMLELGVFGPILFTIGYLLLWRRALRFLRRDQSRVSVWICTYLFFILVYNFSERTILDQNSIFWVLYTSTAVNLYLEVPVNAKGQETLQPFRLHSSAVSPEAA